jgi:protein-tyrosine-phosphatase
MADIEIVSAGFHAENGGPADSMALAISTKFGVDLASHTTTRFSTYDILPSDLVLVMDAFHINYIQRHRPDLADAVVLLGSFCQNKEFPLMIGDPWSQGEVSFNFCYRQIEDALAGLKKYLGEVNR